MYEIRDTDETGHLLATTDTYPQALDALIARHTDFLRQLHDNNEGATGLQLSTVITDADTGELQIATIHRPGRTVTQHDIDQYDHQFRTYIAYG